MSRSTLIKIFLVALLVRIIYSFAAPAIFSNVDTEGYYYVGMNIIQHPSLSAFINPYRTPVYPLFLNAVMYILGVGGTEFGSPAFSRGAEVVVAVQMIVGAMAFTVFYQILSRFLPRRSFLLFTGFLLFDVFVIGWERTLITQGLAISVSLATTAVLFSILLRPTGKKFFLVFLLSAFGFFIRPQFIGLPIVGMPIIAWQYRKRGQIVWWSCVTLAAALSVPLAYARIDYINYKYFGLQFGGDIATLGRILELNIPIESAKSNTYFYSIVNDSRATNHITMPFRFLENYDPTIYGKTYRLVELAAFNETVITHTLPLFVVRGMGAIPEILLEVCDFTRVSATSTHLLTRILWILQQGYGYAQYATLAVPILWIFMSIVWVVKPTKWHTLITLTGTIAMSEIILTALTMYKDMGQQYARIISIVRPQLFLFLFLCAVTVMHAYRKRRHKT